MVYGIRLQTMTLRREVRPETTARSSSENAMNPGTYGRLLAEQAERNAKASQDQAKAMAVAYSGTGPSGVLNYLNSIQKRTNDPLRFVGVNAKGKVAANPKPAAQRPGKAVTQMKAADGTRSYFGGTDKKLLPRPQGPATACRAETFPYLGGISSSGDQAARRVRMEWAMSGVSGASAGWYDIETRERNSRGKLGFPKERCGGGHPGTS